MDDAYVAVRLVDDAPTYEAVLVPAGVSPRDRYEHVARSFGTRAELDALCSEWGVTDVRGARVER